MDLAFHIGYHKTASSWLQQTYFPAHPEIAMICDPIAPWDDPLLRCLIATSDRKFNSRECRDLLSERVAAQAERGDKCVSLVSAERLSGYPMSGGFDSLRIAERLHCVASGAKIIVIVREQVEMISSVYKQMVSEGYPGRFDDMLNSSTWKSTGFDLSYYEYDLLINRYRSLFSEQNVLVLPYELMRSDSGEFVQHLCEFLDVERMDPPREKRLVNRSLPVSSLGPIRWLNHFRRSELNPYPVFNIPDRMRKTLTKVIAAVSRKFTFLPHFMSEAQRTWIADYYKDSNERLNKLVGINFSDYLRRQRP